ncbi:IPExxxVDY family protein [Flavobacterium sp. SUN052]|uniref:IPExxxVDY family protein n=1 Tax=Flavobacterium sp. SUN052 TaxID=3002441 RepID=UPI00237D5398|nr:IPExxxVDY family protein [Flavobacterium sp. SUN052]MEC4004244.1 IPExxxVDY family protein [Flavobacterium sp. SUN052]
MAVHKLYIEEFEEEDYHIIAIHTSLEDYRLAYFLNRNLEIRLSKNGLDIQSKVKEGTTSFARFSFSDEEKFINWDLVQNKNEIEGVEKSASEDLFSNTKNTFSSAAYLLPEYKKVDFFLKIENAKNEINILEIVSKISKIDNVSMTYNVDKNKIKSKNNLIF